MQGSVGVHCLPRRRLVSPSGSVGWLSLLAMEVGERLSVPG